MAIFSVHTQPAAPRPAADARFLYEGFSWRAFFLGPVWFIRHGLFLALLVWTLAFLGLIAVAILALPASTSVMITLLLQTLLGLEANHLLEGHWARRGYRLVQIIAAPNQEEAEITFYRQNPESETKAPERSGAREILGSFPRPEARP
jgi:hypothetical protein